MIKGERKKSVIFKSNNTLIGNIFNLPYVGGGTDGTIFRYGDNALKLLKFDINTRKEKDLMTFEKALTLTDKMSLQRFVAPTDILLDEDGSYCGYVMPFLDDVTLPKIKGTPKYKEVSMFTCGELVGAITELLTDVDTLNRFRMLIKDINDGSYIYTTDFMHICDMDKYRQIKAETFALNQNALNLIIAKFFIIEVKKKYGKSDEVKKKATAWVKKSSNDPGFLERIISEIGTAYTTSIGDYTEEKSKEILRIK